MLFTTNNLLLGLRNLFLGQSNNPGNVQSVPIQVTRLKTSAGLTLTASTAPLVAAFETNAVGIQWAADSMDRASFNWVVPYDYDQVSDTLTISTLVNSAGTSDSPTLTATVYQKRAATALSADLGPFTSSAISKTSATTGATETTIAISGEGLQAGDSLTIQIGPSGTGVDSITLDTAGSGYTAAPVVSFTGGGGTGAAATVTLDGDALDTFTVTDAGSGYTSVPTVVLTGGGGADGAATAVLEASSHATDAVNLYGLSLRYRSTVAPFTAANR